MLTVYCNNGRNLLMPKSEIFEKIIKISDLSTVKGNSFRWQSNVASNSKIAEQLDLISLGKIDFRGKISAHGKNKWLLSGKLGASVVQKCVVTQEAEKCRLEENVKRLPLKVLTEIMKQKFLGEDVKRVYVPITEISPLEKDEWLDVNMELDETLEPLTDTLDLYLLALETLALALPDYPRSNDTDY